MYKKNKVDNMRFSCEHRTDVLTRALGHGSCFAQPLAETLVSVYCGPTPIPLRALSSLRGLRGAPEAPPLGRETSASRTANVGTVGMNGLKDVGFVIPEDLKFPAQVSAHREIFSKSY